MFAFPPCANATARGRRYQDGSPHWSRYACFHTLETKVSNQMRKNDFHLEQRQTHANAAPYAASERQIFMR
jgi:hypothetical protein